MLVNVRQLLGGSLTGEKTIPLSFALDLSYVRRWGERPFEGPVQVRGVLRGASGILTISYTAEYGTALSCARCLDPVRSRGSYAGEHTVLEDVQSGEEEAAYALAPGGILDVGALVTADLLLSMEEVVLCREDCRGLCPKCGRNRNRENCGCDLKEADPRFDALRKHFNQDTGS